MLSTVDLLLAASRDSTLILRQMASRREDPAAGILADVVGSLSDHRLRAMEQMRSAAPGDRQSLEHVLQIMDAIDRLLLTELSLMNVTAELERRADTETPENGAASASPLVPETDLADSSDGDRLSACMAEIERLADGGLTNAEIARRLGIDTAVVADQADPLRAQGRLRARSGWPGYRPGFGAGNGSHPEPAALPLAGRYEELTMRQRQVAALALSGRTNLEIAAELVISVNTVESHMKEIFVKLGIRHRCQLIPIALNQVPSISFASVIAQ